MCVCVFTFLIELVVLLICIYCVSYLIAAVPNLFDSGPLPYMFGLARGGMDPGWEPLFYCF